MYISCAREAIYGSRELPDPEAVWVPGPRSAEDLGIYVVEEVYAADQYRSAGVDRIFAQDDDFTRALCGFYEQIDVREVFPSVLTLIENAILYNSVILVGTAEPVCVYETQRANDRPAARAPDASQLAEIVELRLDPAIDYLFLGSAGSFNYGHFLVDDLPRLKALTLISRTSDRPQIVLMTTLGETIDQVREEAVRLTGGAHVGCRFLPRDVALRGGPILYVSPVSSHPLTKSPAALRFVRDRLTAVLSSSTADSTPARLFIPRSPHHGRTLDNQQDVAAVLTEEGYTVFRPEAHPFSVQVATFLRASSVIGQMGAAMTNTMFCPPDTQARYLAPRGWIEPFYWDLAAAAGQDYRVLYGAPTTFRADHHLNDYSIDLTELSCFVSGPNEAPGFP